MNYLKLEVLHLIIIIMNYLKLELLHLIIIIKYKLRDKRIQFYTTRRLGYFCLLATFKNFIFKYCLLNYGGCPGRSWIGSQLWVVEFRRLLSRLSGSPDSTIKNIIISTFYR